MNLFLFQQNSPFPHDAHKALVRWRYIPLRYYLIYEGDTLGSLEAHWTLSNTEKTKFSKTITGFKTAHAAVCFIALPFPVRPNTDLIPTRPGVLPSRYNLCPRLASDMATVFHDIC